MLCCLALRLCNAAIGKAAYQISDAFEYGRPYPAVLATDGTRITSLQADSCAVSGVAADPWWGVDLGAWMTVSHVVLSTRKYNIHYIAHVDV